LLSINSEKHDGWIRSYKGTILKIYSEKSIESTSICLGKTDSEKPIKAFEHLKLGFYFSLPS